MLANWCSTRRRVLSSGLGKEASCSVGRLNQAGPGRYPRRKKWWPQESSLRHRRATSSSGSARGRPSTGTEWWSKSAVCASSSSLLRICSWRWKSRSRAACSSVPSWWMCPRWTSLSRSLLIYRASIHWMPQLNAYRRQERRLYDRSYCRSTGLWSLGLGRVCWPRGSLSDLGWLVPLGFSPTQPPGWSHRVMLTLPYKLIRMQLISNLINLASFNSLTQSEGQIFSQRST